MTPEDIIKKNLPEDLRELAKSFVIPENYLNSDNELIILILRSKSIDKPEEKQSRFNLLSIMNKEQIDRLRDILVREKKKLEEIENKYEQKKEEIKKKYENKFKVNDYERTMDKLEAVENIHREKEHQEADNLLDQI